MDLEIPGELIPKPQSATMPATGRMNRNFATRWIYSMAWLVDLMIMLRRISDRRVEAFSSKISPKYVPLAPRGTDPDCRGHLTHTRRSTRRLTHLCWSI